MDAEKPWILSPTNALNTEILFKNKTVIFANKSGLITITVLCEGGHDTFRAVNPTAEE